MVLPGSLTSTDAATVRSLELKTFQQIMPHAPPKFLQPLNAAMRRHEINTGKRIAAFLAQVAVESNELRHTHELWSSKKDFKLPGVHRAAYTATSKEDYFKHWYGKRTDLGNATAEDGYTYRGRGAIQVTGKSNYAAIASAIGYPLITQPDLLETDVTADMLASAYFFAGLKKLNPVADGVLPDKLESIVAVNKILTQRVNGGANGISERLAYFKKGLLLLAE
jgi:putative chitinase